MIKQLLATFLILSLITNCSITEHSNVKKKYDTQYTIPQQKIVAAAELRNLGYRIVKETNSLIATAREDVTDFEDNTYYTWITVVPRSGVITVFCEMHPGQKKTCEDPFIQKDLAIAGVFLKTVMEMKEQTYPPIDNGYAYLLDE